MRKWGPVVAALLIIGYISSLFSPDPEPTSQPAQTTQSASPSTSQSLEPTPIETSNSAEPEPAESEAEPEATEAEAEPEPSETEQPENQSASPTASESEQPSEEPEPTENQPVAQESEPATDTISALLLQLEIEAEFEGAYDRDVHFGDWIDADRDGCNTRREVLIAEAIEAPTIGSGCELIGGLWYSAFDDEYERDDSQFDIDHMAPLSEAWDSGANEWTREQRVAFANDLDLPQALIAVTRSTNRSKGDRDPADWLPPLQSYHCQYVEDWVRIKVKWELSVDQREFDAIRGVLATC